MGSSYVYKRSALTYTCRYTKRKVRQYRFGEDLLRAPFSVRFRKYIKDRLCTICGIRLLLVMIAISIALLLPMVSYACFVSNVVRPSEEHTNPNYVYDMEPILSKISVDDSYSGLWDDQNSYKIGERFYLRYNEDDIFMVDRHDEQRSDITAVEMLDVLNREFGSNFSIRVFELRDNLVLHIGMNRGTYIYERRNVKRETKDGTDLNILASKLCVDRNRGLDPSCGDNVSSGNKYKSAHNCGNQGGKGYQCSKPQGPSGNNYGLCCYTLKTAKSCQYEGGVCFTDKTKIRVVRSLYMNHRV
uniref:ARAD1D51282p n=1 Tax=Blastobotrys adeninivorans TaxID=409370 RepID=A0A060TK05_BLAAD